MPRQETLEKETATDAELRRFYQSVVEQTAPARFQALFLRLRDAEKELEHEG